MSTRTTDSPPHHFLRTATALHSRIPASNDPTVPAPSHSTTSAAPSVTASQTPRPSQQQRHNDASTTNEPGNLLFGRASRAYAHAQRTHNYNHIASIEVEALLAAEYTSKYSTKYSSHSLNETLLHGYFQLGEAENHVQGINYINTSYQYMSSFILPSTSTDVNLRDVRRMCNRVNKTQTYSAPFAAYILQCMEHNPKGRAYFLSFDTHPINATLFATYWETRQQQSAQNTAFSHPVSLPTGNITYVTELIDYVYRHPNLNTYNPYWFTAFFTKVRIPTHPPPLGFTFTPDHPQYETHWIVPRTTVVYPQLLQDPPVRPSDDTEDVDAQRSYAGMTNLKT